MKLNDVGIVIASREFSTSNGESMTVVIGKPEKFPDSEDYYCPWQYLGKRSSVVKRAGGVDSAQALIGALKCIGAELNASPEGMSGELTWVGSVPTDNVGFPVTDSCADLLERKKRG